MYAEAIYKAKATTWGWTETSNGNPQFWMTFDVKGVMDRNHLDAQLKPTESGAGTWTITPTTDKSSDWLISTVQSLGYDREDVLGLDPENTDAFNFEGVEFNVQCKHEEYNGQTREKWSVYNPRRKSRLAADKLAALNARLGSKVRDMKEQRVAKAAVTVASAPQTNATDEPF